jgi:hypothetical protein
MSCSDCVTRRVPTVGCQAPQESQQPIRRTPSKTKAWVPSSRGRTPRPTRAILDLQARLFCPTESVRPENASPPLLFCASGLVRASRAGAQSVDNSGVLGRSAFAPGLYACCDLWCGRQTRHKYSAPHTNVRPTSYYSRISTFASRSAQVGWMDLV